jgi:septum site-determining protein MinC
MIDVSFQLKGSALTVVVLALVDYDPATLASELKEKIDQAPHFFVNSPVLISLERFESPETCIALLENALGLIQICRQLDLQPLGFTGVPDVLLPAVQKTGLAILPKPSERALKVPGGNSGRNRGRDGYRRTTGAAPKPSGHPPGAFRPANLCRGCRPDCSCASQ